MSFDMQALKTALESGPVVRVLILSHKGSAPRETGTVMLVMRDGASGTIGGGALELQAIKLAQRVLEDRKSCIQTFPLGPALGQCCGGSVTLLIEFFDAIPEGSDSFFTRNIAGAKEKPFAIKRAESSIRNGSGNSIVTFTDGWVTEATRTPKQNLWLFGAGHVGRAIVDVLDELSFDITWIDTATDRFPAEPKATPLIAVDPSRAAKHAPPDAIHLVLTYSHAIDLAICHAVLGQPHHSLGLIGSATKRTRFEKRLRELGHTHSATDSIICPIGDPALGKEPKAIAIGVAAQLMKLSAADCGAIPVNNQSTL